MKNKIKLAVFLTLALSFLSIGLAHAAFTKEGNPKPSSFSNPLNAPGRKHEKRIQSATPDPQSVSTEHMAAVQSATVNFAKLALQEALVPPIHEERRFVPEPREEEDDERARPIPAGALIFPEKSAVFSPPQPLIPSPVVSASFQGSPASGWIPPDTQGAAGPNHLMVAVNGNVRIQTKTGTTLMSQTLVNFFAAVANGSGFVFDPRVEYDPYGNRWILIAGADVDSANSAILVGTSQTSDPTGNWNLKRIDADPQDLSSADYPMLGFSKNWIVVSANMFSLPGRSTPFYSRFFVLNKTNFYAGGGSYTQISAPNNVSGSIMPAKTQDANLTTMYLLQNWNGNFGGNGFLRLYTITGAVGSETLNNVSTGIFFSTPNPWDFAPPTANFAPQLGTSNKINVGDARMHNVVYRNGSLWCVHNVFLPAGGAPTRSSVQWWQINPTSNSVQQRARIDSTSGLFYAFPSIAVNQNNDVMIGYSRFSSSQFAGADYAYRAGTDAANTLRDDTVLKAGAATYSALDEVGRNRWGDYSATTVDPTNDIDFWTLQEYVASTDTWATWWGKIGTTTCNAPGSFSLISPTDGQSLSSTTSTMLSWGASANADSYDVYFGTSSNPPFLANQTATSRSVSVTPGLTYFWKVVARVNCNSSLTFTTGIRSFFVQTTLPDLIVTSLTAPTTGSTGGQITVGTTIVNQGLASAGASHVEFYLSTDSVITTADIDTGWGCSLPGLAAGGSTTCSGPIGVPSSIPPGIYFFGAIADNLGAVAESNESNNARTADTGPIVLSSGCTTPISIGQTINGALTTSSCRSPIRGSSYYSDRYSFNASAGQQVAVLLRSATFDTYLYLLGPSGAVIAEDDDGGGGTDGTDSRIPPGSGFFTLPSSGTYIIEATSFGQNVTGNYTVGLTGGSSHTTTTGLYAPVGGAFFFRFSNTSGPSDYAFTFGPANQGWTPVIGDWNGDGVSTIGLYFPANGAFYIRNSNTSGIADIYITYGPAGQGWLPVIGDWDGNGTETVGLYNPGNGNFYLRNSNTVGFADLTFAFGPIGGGWMPIVGDWNGDGVDTVGLYNPFTGAVQLRNSNTAGAADVSFTFTGAGPTWKPIIGDWDGNGTSTLGLYNPATGVFSLRNTNTTGGADVSLTWEGGNYVPLAGKWQ